jgi:hypothetical protein
VTVRWPIAVTWEGSTTLHEDPQRLAESLEFLDDQTEEYWAVDAVGNRILLVVHSLNLLVCQVIPRDFALTDRELVGTDDLWVEVWRGLPLRALTAGRALPETWQAPVSWTTLRVAPSELQAQSGLREFHERWVASALRRR